MLLSALRGATEPADAGTRTSRYDAFLSYSHQDEEWAKAVQSGLQRLARPWNRLRALAVFRDRSDLAANPDLWESVRHAMDTSRYLIVLASPQARLSEWVDREVRYWLATRGLDSVLVVVVAGEWRLGAGTAQEPSSAVLPALADAYLTEPRHIDVQHLTRETWTLRAAEWRQAIAELAAPLHDKPKAELYSEDQRLFLQARRLRRSVKAALGVLTAIAVVLTLITTDSLSQVRDAQARADASRRVANDEQARARAARAEAGRAIRDARTQEARAETARRQVAQQEALAARLRQRADTAKAEADRQIRIAKTQEDIASDAMAETVRQREAAADAQADARRQAALATSRRMADQSQALLERDPPDARRLALAAWRVAPTSEARGALIATWHDSAEQVIPTSSKSEFFATFLGEHLVTVERDGFHEWNLRTGLRVRSLSLKNLYVSAITATPDGRYIVISDDSRVTLWDLREMKRVRTVVMSLDDFTEKVVVRSDGQAFGAVGDRGVSWWDSRTGRLCSRIPIIRIGEVTGTEQPTMDLSSDGALFAVARDRHVVRWDLSTGRRTEPGVRLAGWASGLTVSPDGRLAVGLADDGSGPGGGSVSAWDLRSGAATGRLPYRHLSEDEFTQAHPAFSPDGSTIVAMFEEGLRRWEIRSGRDLGVLGPPAPYSSRFSADGQALVTAYGDAHRVWNLERMGTVRRPDDEVDDADSVFLVSGNSRLVVAGRLGAVRLHHVPSGTALATYKPRPGRHWPIFFRQQPPRLDTSIATDGNHNVFVGAGDLVQVFRSDGPMRELRRFTLPRPELSLFPRAAASPLVLSPRAGKAAYIRSGKLLIYDFQKRKEVAQLATKVSVNELAVSPDGRTLAVAEDRRVSLYDIGRHRYLGAIDNEWTRKRLAFSPDGARLAVSGDRTGDGQDDRLAVYSTQSRRKLRGAYLTSRSVNDIDFSSDGRTIALANQSGTVELWESDSLDLIVSAKGNEDSAAHSVDFGENHGLLTLGRADGSVSLWETDPNRIAVRICREYGGPFTKKEWKAYAPGHPYLDICAVTRGPVQAGH